MGGWLPVDVHGCGDRLDPRGDILLQRPDLRHQVFDGRASRITGLVAILESGFYGFGKSTPLRGRNRFGQAEDHLLQ